MTYIDLDLCNYSLGTEIRIGPAHRLTVKRITEAVADHYGVPRATMQMKQVDRHIAQVRQVAMYLARQHTDMSYPGLAQRFGGLDHSTVIHGVEAVRKRLSRSGDLADDLKHIRLALLV